MTYFTGHDADQKLIARVGGNVENGTDLFITNHKARLIFTSDSMVEKKGFFMSYHAIGSDFPSCKILFVAFS